MIRRSAIAILALGLAFWFAPLPASAGIGLHLQSAMDHAQDAIETGARGDADAILTHVRGALGHAREALHAESAQMDRAGNRLVHDAIRHLRKAEMRARFGDSANAIKHTVDALTEMKKVK
jgi:hypothetical protein